MASFSVQGKNVVITGASSGIGKELSACFAQQGANCFLGCLPAERNQLTSWAEKLRQEHAVRVHLFPLDLSQAEGPEQFHASIRALGEPIHVLVNNAGIIAYGSFGDLPLELQEKIIHVNVIAYFKLMRLFLPQLTAAGEGRILNVVSASAFQPSPYLAVYGAGKAFIQMLSEALNAELIGSGVRVQTLNPPYTNTPLLKGHGFPKQLWWYRI
ncbi:MAG: SDR family NAD(P)-dependent oxidoreductase, partial [Candidatus Firestonebacteria bacterium]|nr:SDR family NAD(P)-dependent oxidoreductase [Candidatus Firestonebacteria bacterium]